MSQDHYFSASPDSPSTTREVSVPIAGKSVTLRIPGGTFSTEGLDRGTKVLLANTPAPPGHGVFVDVGCGWGPIALTLATLSPGANIYAVDVNERALAATQSNAARLGLRNIQTTSPENFPRDVAIDLIWSNPPIRIGKQALHDLLTTWLCRMSVTGEAWLVVAKQLGSDSLQRWINEGGAGEFQCERIETDKGFRVLRVTRG